MMEKLIRLINDRLAEQNQQDFAIEIGVNQSTVNRWRFGVCPNFEGCLRIACGLGLHPREIMLASGNQEHVAFWDRLMLFEPKPQNDPQDPPSVERMKRILRLGDKCLVDTTETLIEYLERLVVRDRH